MAFAILLILVLQGILDGTVGKATVYIDRSGADLFVAQGGIEHMALFGSASVVPATVEAGTRATPGVAAATGIFRFPTILNVRGAEEAVNVVGFSPDAGLGGPWSMASGTTALSPDGIIVDSALARARGLRLGDQVMVAGHAFRIEGLARGTNVLGGRLAFIRRDTAAALLMAPAVYSFVLVRTAPGAALTTVAAALRNALPQQSIMTRATLAANDRRLLTGLFVTPVNVMATIGLGVGLMVVGLTTYTAAAERTRDFGVLKAIGARNSYLYRVIVQQALLIGLFGFAAGVALALVAVPVIAHLVPDLGVQLQWPFMARTFGIAAAMSLAAAVIPVRRIAGVDPKLVFKT